MYCVEPVVNDELLGPRRFERTDAFDMSIEDLGHLTTIRSVIKTLGPVGMRGLN
jgi:hypothetical protein